VENVLENFPCTLFLTVCFKNWYFICRNASLVFTVSLIHFNADLVIF